MVKGTLAHFTSNLILTHFISNYYNLFFWFFLSLSILLNFWIKYPFLIFPCIWYWRKIYLLIIKKILPVLQFTWNQKTHENSSLSLKFRFQNRFCLIGSKMVKGQLSLLYAILLYEKNSKFLKKFSIFEKIVKFSISCLYL